MIQFLDFQKSNFKNNRWETQQLLTHCPCFTGKDRRKRHWSVEVCADTVIEKLFFSTPFSYKYHKPMNANRVRTQNKYSCLFLIFFCSLWRASGDWSCWKICCHSILSVSLHMWWVLLRRWKNYLSQLWIMDSASNLLRSASLSVVQICKTPKIPNII